MICQGQIDPSLKNIRVGNTFVPPGTGQYILERFINFKLIKNDEEYFD
jgi:hypothetical protein